MKGLIALDIDGTLTPPGKAIAWEVVHYLNELINNHWQLVFITGRTFHFGYQVVSHLPFPFYYAVQNGAITLEMPSRTILNKRLLDKSVIPLMEKVCEGQPSDFVIYTGFEQDDICFYRPHCFSNELRDYLKARTQRFKETWIDVPNFDGPNINEFASVKCFGNLESATLIADRIERLIGLHVPLIRDPFNQDYYVAQAIHGDVSKGSVVKYLKEILKPDITIAAGDDYNDLPMLSAADIKIVMSTAPIDMHRHADIIAPKAEEHGIIAGINQAISKIKKIKK